MTETSRGHADPTLRRILAGTRTIAMVGAGPDGDRNSHNGMRNLQQQGYRVIPVKPTVPEGKRIPGECVSAELASIPDPVDAVDVFRKPAAIAGIVDEGVALETWPCVFWLQLGVVDENAVARARDAGITAVMDRCLNIEHRRLGT